MIKIESTADMAERIYRRMTEQLSAARRRLARPLTLAEKLLLGHLEDPQRQQLEPGASYLRIMADRVVLQDVLGQTAFLQFMQTGRERVALPVSVHCDHLIRAHEGTRNDLRTSLAQNREVYEFLKSAARRYGAGFWEPGAGIIHQVVLEQYSFPGQIIFGTDSHTPNAGGLGACAIGVGGAEAVEAMAGAAVELLYPKRFAVYLTGELGGWTAPKDVVLHVLGQLTVSGATNAIVEYIGPGAGSISATGKATICNMGAEMGATTSIFAYDDRMATYLHASGRESLAAAARLHAALLAPDPECELDPERHYDRVIRLDLSTLEPQVSGPHSPDRTRPLSAFLRELRSQQAEAVAPLKSVLLGSCTNSSYEDMCRAADVAAQASLQGASVALPLFVTPGSERIRATIAEHGQLRTMEKIGARVLANACGPCIGQWHRTDATDGRPNYIVTTFNRNFMGRNDGRNETMNLIVSPELAMAFALAGRVDFDPRSDAVTNGDGRAFKLAAPALAPDVPNGGFADPGGYHEPAADGTHVEIRIADDSKRLQRLAPWPRWDGADFADLPVLVKVKGKTTTDQISPAGRWLELRGHLDRFSDNFLMGGINAWSGEQGKALDTVGGTGTHSVAEVARLHRSRGLRWIVVGDANYGEGSSREHAALSPRLLGGAAIIARSFARIHESNLKKQGLLALTFADPEDYERIEEGDRISLLQLDRLSADRPIPCRITHTDGRTLDIDLKHSYSAEQLGWFKAGSALNCLQQA